ncbi:hypothetical protein COOONC_06662 [Cooperia oncophora]
MSATNKLNSLHAAMNSTRNLLSMLQSNKLQAWEMRQYEINRPGKRRIIQVSHFVQAAVNVGTVTVASFARHLVYSTGITQRHHHTLSIRMGADSYSGRYFQLQNQETETHGVVLRLGRTSRAKDLKLSFLRTVSPQLSSLDTASITASRKTAITMTVQANESTPQLQPNSGALPGPKRNRSIVAFLQEFLHVHILREPSKPAAHVQKGKCRLICNATPCHSQARTSSSKNTAIRLQLRTQVGSAIHVHTTMENGNAPLRLRIELPLQPPEHCLELHRLLPGRVVAHSRQRCLGLQLQSEIEIDNDISTISSDSVWQSVKEWTSVTENLAVFAFLRTFVVACVAIIFISLTISIVNFFSHTFPAKKRV